MEILKTIPYSEFNLWDVNRYSNEVELLSIYKLVPLYSLLYQSSNYEKIRNEKEYYLCGLSSYGNGLFHREIKLGKDIKGTKLNQISKGQFIYSRLGANNGSFDIVSDQFDKYWVTNEFPTFNISNDLNPEYLKVIFKLKRYWKIISRKLQGAAHKRFKEKLFLELKIPLPPLSEQNRLVANYKSKIKLANEQEQNAKALEQEIENYLFEVLGIEKLVEKEKQLLKIVNYSNLDRWDNTKSFVLNSKYPVVKAKNIILNISTGTTPPTSKREYFDKGNINFYTPADLTDKMYLKEAKRKVTKLAFDDGKSRQFKKNTLLFVGIGSTVGKVGIIANDFATSNQQITGLNFDFSKANIEYLYYYFNNFINITTIEKTQATIPIVNQDKILNIPIPIPPLKIQTQIANHISALKQQIKDLQNKAKENREKAIQEFEEEIFS